MLAFIVPVGGQADNTLPGGVGGHPGNSLPIPPNYPSNRPPGSGNRPDQGLPGNQPGPDQGLPGGGYPSQGLPVYPDLGLPSGQGGLASSLPTDEAWILAFHPAHGYKWISASSIAGGPRPGQGLPGGRPGRPDQGLPGEQPEVDQDLPGSGTGSAPKPDQGLPPHAQPKK
jgi:hypothetical protein